MDKYLRLLIGSGIFLLLGACGILILYILVDVPEEVAKPNAPIERTATRSQAVSAITPFPKQVSRAEVESSQSSVPSPQPSPQKSSGPTVDPVEEILGRTNADFPTTVNQLLAALPKLNPEQQAEAAQHIANLSDDTLAAQWAQKMIAQSLPQSASEVLFNDLLNRPHEMLLPILSKLADMPKHPQNTQSVEILDVLFGQPPVGSNWGKWVKMKAQEVP